jgi:hypothetical protein
MGSLGTGVGWGGVMDEGFFLNLEHHALNHIQKLTKVNTAVASK